MEFFVQIFGKNKWTLGLFCFLIAIVCYCLIMITIIVSDSFKNDKLKQINKKEIMGYFKKQPIFLFLFILIKSQLRPKFRALTQ